MGSENLTIGSALKFARHDFLNELQLMLLYLDLGKTAEARKTLLETTERMRHVSLLEKLQLPETELLLSTFDWMYTVFSKSLTCHIEAGPRAVEDEAVVSYLKALLKTIEEGVDPLSDYHIDVLVKATSEEWSIQLTVTGSLTHIPQFVHEQRGFLVRESKQEQQWTFTLSGR
ncbi:MULTISPECIES: Spo0B domain-containing protein [Sporosarcina]|uniref:Spo0B domain-containing protein n=1 Tax=Sporosarcina saromensis TaxID=359365 RepID=A0ABU4G7M9_9BACL|nr:Spo0B domain-containing protein [Sporosarcina saromensis]MDW0112367.1 Spo0B domain-containing protein [Sporosarcina saromensis]